MNTRFCFSHPPPLRRFCQPPDLYTSDQRHFAVIVIVGDGRVEKKNVQNILLCACEEKTSRRSVGLLQECEEKSCSRFILSRGLGKNRRNCWNKRATLHRYFPRCFFLCPFRLKVAACVTATAYSAFLHYSKASPLSCQWTRLARAQCRRRRCFLNEYYPTLHATFAAVNLSPTIFKFFKIPQGRTVELSIVFFITRDSTHGITKVDKTT